MSKIQNRKAVYAGSFDPLTNGHVWLIERALGLFDELIVAVGVNSNKTYLLTAQERRAHMEDFLKSQKQGSCQVSTAVIENEYLVTFAQSQGATCLLRGIRSAHDFNYEYAMTQVNKKLAPNLECIYLLPPPHLAQVSSSLVKSLIGPKGWPQLVENYVPANVFQSLLDRWSEDFQLEVDRT